MLFVQETFEMIENNNKNNKITEKITGITNVKPSF